MLLDLLSSYRSFFSEKRMAYLIFQILMLPQICLSTMIFIKLTPSGFWIQCAQQHVFSQYRTGQLFLFLRSLRHLSNTKQHLSFVVKGYLSPGERYQQVKKNIFEVRVNYTSRMSATACLYNQGHVSETQV